MKTILIILILITVICFYIYIYIKNKVEYVEIKTGTVFILKDIISSTTGIFYKLQSTENGEIRLVLKEKVDYWYRKIDDYDK